MKPKITYVDLIIATAITLSIVAMSMYIVDTLTRWLA